MPFDEAIAQARIKGDKPLLIADTSDQTGSGAPGDTTHVMQAFIDAGIRNAAIAPLWDPLAVGICFQVGVGARMRLRIGGKFEPHSGPPLDVDAEVLFLKRDAHQDQLSDERIGMGDVAVVRVEGIEILLTTQRTSLFSPSMFTLHGITFDDKQVIAIKNLYKHKDLFVDQHARAVVRRNARDQQSRLGRPALQAPAAPDLAARSGPARARLTRSSAAVSCNRSSQVRVLRRNSASRALRGFPKISAGGASSTTNP